jgi:pimeloyl-ACP methyl ester carboxylesterase
VLARHRQAPGAARDLAFVVAHGFTGSSSGPVSRGMAQVLARSGGVVAFDFRGHGGSGGLSTVGDLEVLDLAAAAGWARLLGYRRIVPVGFSLGASVAVRYAGLVAGTPDAVDAVVAVSGPSRWHYRGTPPMRLLHRGVETPIGRAVLAAGYGTRIAASGWDPWPEPPDALAGRVAPAPLLVVHGDADRYFPLDHARWLVEAARGAAELWVERGFGHAEAAATPELLERVAGWVLERVASPTPATP